MSKMASESLDEKIEEIFPAPGFRDYQKEVIKNTVRLVEEEDVEVVQIDAPPGFGKSITLWTIGRLLGKTFYTTPLNTLVDQLEEDEFIGDDIITVKGRNNYKCIHEEDFGTSVDRAICQKDSNFECDIKGDCEYYGRKNRALKHHTVVTNMSYKMAESMIPDFVEHKFRVRDDLTLDECQNLDDFARNYISFTLSKFTVPSEVWDNIKLPPKSKEDDMEFLAEWLEEHVLGKVKSTIEYISQSTLMSDGEMDDLESLQEFERKVRNFLTDFEENPWVCEIKTEIRKNKENYDKIVFEPVEIGGHMENFLWDSADTIILSSATIPPDGWLETIGLGDRKSVRLKVPHQFPLENRPIVTAHMVGKMTKSERKKNALPMGKKIMQIAENHEGEKGFVHCRSYGIAHMIRRSLSNNGYGSWVRNNVYIQDGDDREGSLENWLNSDKQVYFSVNMAEGIDLKGDKARWQALAKVLYPFRDKRWEWMSDNYSNKEYWDRYNRKAVIQMEQAYGRAIRSRDDEAVFYLLDGSVENLLKMNAELFHTWFLDAVNKGTELAGSGIKVDPSRGI